MHNKSDLALTLALWGLASKPDRQRDETDPRWTVIHY